MSKDTKKRQRRVRGTGSYRQVREGVYELKIGCGKRADGKPRYKYETIHGSPLDAERRLMQLSAELEADNVVGSGYTWKMFYEKQFLPYLESKEVTNATKQTYATVYPKVVEVGFADRELTDIPTIAEVQAWADKMTRGAGEQALKAYKAVLNYAFKRGYFPNAPYGKYPFKREKCDEKPEDEIWDEDDLATAMVRMEGHRLEGYLLVAGGCGCRKEEALDLVCERDFEIWHRKGETIIWVKIDSAFTPADGVKGTKTAASVRNVPICGVVAERLEKYLEGRTGYLVQDLKGNRLGITGLRKSWDLLFRDEIPKKPGVRGSYYRPPGILHDLPRITPNKLRHVHTTIMGDCLVGDTIIAQYHGHVPPTTHGKFYSRRHKKRHDKAFVAAAQLVDKVMKKALKHARKNA